MKGKESTDGRRFRPSDLGILIVVVITVVLALWIRYKRPSHPPEIAYRRQCLSNLRQLGLAMHVYAQENGNKYPSPATWCDALLTVKDPNAAEYLQCPTAAKAGENGKCQYAINPNASPDSQPPVVLLFESKGGWNLQGGPEMMLINRHGESGCNVLLSDGSGIFVTPETVNSLNWGTRTEQTDTSEKEQEMAQLKIGDKAPKFTLTDQNGNKVSLSDFAGKKVLVYFYPKADTPGCTTQACSIRDSSAELDKLGVISLGISPDMPEAQKKFDDKFTLGFRLLSDPDHKVASAYGAWGQKNMYGKITEGIIRSSFLIDEEGKIIQLTYKVKPEATVPDALEAISNAGK